MTAGEELRHAARLMLKRAQAASAGPWFSWQEGRDGCGGDSFIGNEGDDDLYVTVGSGYHPKWEADQDYIASMHPLVALAVARWLSSVARRRDDDAHSDPEPEDWNAALAVARAYRGESKESDD